jgi:putative glycosyltransferase
MKLSIVTPLYRSAPYIAEFHRRTSVVATALAGDDYEIIMVNDGSPDDGLDIAVALSDTDPHVVVVDLSRNFGHHKAIMTGLATAVGDLVFLIDSDLEEEPEWLLHFEKQMRAEASDMVYGVQATRKGDWFERHTGAIFYRLFRCVTGTNQPDNVVTARIMSRRYVNALLTHRERELNIIGLWIITGFKQSHQTVKKHATSPTTYSLARKLDNFVNAVTSFSNLPLFFTFYSGLVISASAGLFICYLLFVHLFGSPPSGYTSIVASIWLFSGFIVLFTGMQAIYIGKIFSEVKQRPYTIVRHVYRHPRAKRAGWRRAVRREIPVEFYDESESVVAMKSDAGKIAGPVWGLLEGRDRDTLL